MRLLDLGVSDAMVYCGPNTRMGDYTVNRIPGIDKEGDVTEPQMGEKPDTSELLAASKAVFVHIMEIERAQVLRKDTQDNPGKEQVTV